MRRFLSRLKRDRRGVSALEFAFVAPLLVLMIIGVLQMGLVFYGHSALRNAVSEGARYATIHPRPTAAQVVTRINSKKATQARGTWGTPTVTYTQNATTRNWHATISMTYTTKIDLLFYEWPVTLSYTRRANVYPPA